jgi:hypothetical protein
MTTPFPFQSGAVLQASELNAITTLPINDQTASYTLVVGDVGKRVVMNVASANTVTIDDSIFGVGDTIFIANKGAGATTVTAGAGVTINSASGLALVQNQSGQLVALSASSFLFVASAGPAPTSGLAFISNTAFTTVSSVSLPAATFSATYENYAVLLNLTAASTTISFTGRMRIGGADNTTSNYNTNLSRVTSANAIGQIGNGAQTSFSLSTTDSQAYYSARFDFINPFAANRTFILANIAAVESGVATLGLAGGLGFDATTSFDSFSFIANTGTISGNIRVYGYANS